MGPDQNGVEQEVHVAPTSAPHGLHSPCLEDDFRINQKNTKKNMKGGGGSEDGGHRMSISTLLVSAFKTS